MGWKGLKYFGLVLLVFGFVFILNSASGITGFVVLRDLKVEVSLNLGVGFVFVGVVFFGVGESMGERLDKGLSRRSKRLGGHHLGKRKKKRKGKVEFLY